MVFGNLNILEVGCSIDFRLY